MVVGIQGAQREKWTRNLLSPSPKTKKCFSVKTLIYQRLMKVAKEIPDDSTFSHLGNTALYLIATLPEKQMFLRRNI